MADKKKDIGEVVEKGKKIAEDAKETFEITKGLVGDIVGVIGGIIKKTKGEITFDGAEIHSFTEKRGKLTGWKSYKSPVFTIMGQKYIAGKRHGLYVPWHYEFEYGGSLPDAPQIVQVKNFRVVPHVGEFFNTRNWFCYVKCQKHPTVNNVSGSTDAHTAEIGIKMTGSAGRKIGKKQKFAWTIWVRGDGTRKVA